MPHTVSLMVNIWVIASLGARVYSPGTASGLVLWQFLGRSEPKALNKQNKRLFCMMRGGGKCPATKVVLFIHVFKHFQS